MGISEKKMQIVINNYFKQECDVNTSIREAFEKGFRIGVKKGLSAQTEPHWILCSESPPEPDEEVFVYLWDNVPYIASMNGEGQWDTEYFCVDVEDAPKAWMPLPEPYMGGTE